MARENFLWGAPRIHGELLILGFTVSQATVSRYMPPPTGRMDNRGGLSFAIKPWRSVTASITEERSRGAAGLHIESYWAQLSDPELSRLRPYVLDSGTALPNSRP